MKPRRRAYIIWIPEDEILNLFPRPSGGYIAVTQLQSGLDCHGKEVLIPRDVKVTHADHCQSRRAFGFWLEHESFPEVLPGAECPMLLLHETVGRIGQLIGDPDPEKRIEMDSDLPTLTSLRGIFKDQAMKEG